MNLILRIYDAGISTALHEGRQWLLIQLKDKDYYSTMGLCYDWGERITKGGPFRSQENQLKIGIF